MNRSVIKLLALGLAGLAFAVAVGFAAATISSERIGLSSEPLSAGDDLAPAEAQREPPKPAKPSKPSKPSRSEGQRPQQNPVRTVPPAPTAQGEPTQESEAEETLEHETEPDDDD